MKKFLIYGAVFILSIMSLPFLWLLIAKLSATSRHFGVPAFYSGEPELNFALKHRFERGMPVSTVKQEIVTLGFSCANRFSKGSRVFCTCHQNLLVAHRSWFIDITKTDDGKIENISGNSRTSIRPLHKGAPKCKPFYWVF